MADERTRYSDAELEEFKQLILKKLENARADYELLRATITHTADNDTEDTSPTFKVLEEGAATLSKEESGRLAAHQMKFIRNLEMALVRIENKTYGICKTTASSFPRSADESAARYRVYRAKEGAGNAIRNGAKRRTSAVVFYRPRYDSGRRDKSQDSPDRLNIRRECLMHCQSTARPAPARPFLPCICGSRFFRLAHFFRKITLSLTICIAGSAYSC